MCIRRGMPNQHVCAQVHAVPAFFAEIRKDGQHGNSRDLKRDSHRLLMESIPKENTLIGYLTKKYIPVELY